MKKSLFTLLLIAASIVLPAQEKKESKWVKEICFVATPMKISHQQTVFGIYQIGYQTSPRWLVAIHGGTGVMLHNQSKTYTPVSQLGLSTEYTFLKKSGFNLKCIAEGGDISDYNTDKSNVYYRIGVKSEDGKTFVAIGVQHLFFYDGVKSNNANLYLSYGFKF